MEIGNLKEKEAGISFYDHLTGLPTMTLFFEMAEKGCLDLLKDGKTPAVLFLDLSGMKTFNRKYGFVEGDNVLIALAKLIEEVYGKGFSSRFVQDHFVVFCECNNVFKITIFCEKFSYYRNFFYIYSHQFFCCCFVVKFLLKNALTEIFFKRMTEI